MLHAFVYKYIIVHCQANKLTRLTNNIARQHCFRQAPEVISAKNNTCLVPYPIAVQHKQAGSCTQMHAGSPSDPRSAEERIVSSSTSRGPSPLTSKARCTPQDKCMFMLLRLSMQRHKSCKT